MYSVFPFLIKTFINPFKEYKMANKRRRNGPCVILSLVMRKSVFEFRPWPTQTWSAATEYKRGVQTRKKMDCSIFIVKQGAWRRLAASEKGRFTHDGVNFVLTGMKVRHKFYDCD